MSNFKMENMFGDNKFSEVSLGLTSSIKLVAFPFTFVLVLEFEFDIVFVLSGVGDVDKELEKNLRSELVKLRFRGVLGEFVSDDDDGVRLNELRSSSRKKERSIRS
jgi:hypothetical protein